MQIVGQGLDRRFGKTYALRGLDFECHAGEIVVVLGNNGAGKTTLLQLIAGLIVPSRGEILVDGKAIDRRDETLRRRMAIIPDFPPFFIQHTVVQHLAMLCALHHVDDGGLDARAVALMEEIGILNLAQARMGTLSRGEIYKTVLVGLLLVKPELWLLDEPMASGMDPQGLAFLRKYLREEVANGATVLYTTQIADIAERFSDRVFVLNEGKLVAQEGTCALIERRQVATLEEAMLKVFSELK